MITNIDGKTLQKMFLAGAKSLEAKKEWINELNVFPVPDGDTGTNMSLTIMSAASEVSSIKDPTLANLSKAISSGSLRGARGNSGVILSQLFRGFTKEVKQYDTIDAVILANACERAVETAYKALKKRGKIDAPYKFITFGGDGGTYDIGLQSLSGAMERGHDMVYVCYDNGAYMNTGIQRSSATPMYADTTTTPAGSCSDGKPQIRKDLVAVMAAHNIPYTAQTTFMGNLKDLYVKSEKAIYTEGPAFLNIMAPCPRGWRFEAADMAKICKLAVDTCYWPMFEVDHGKWIINYEPKKKLPIEDFLRPQGRFKHLFKKGNEHLLELFQAEVDRRWEELQAKANM